MNHLLRLIKISLGFAIIFSLFSPSAFAQQASNSNSVGLEVSAPIYEYTIKPGQSQQDIIKIKNVGIKAQTYFPEVADFKSDNKSGTPIILTNGQTGGTYSLSTWITVSKEAINLQPGESNAINFYIKVPAEAEAGGHYGAILFSTEAPTPTGSGVGIASKVGSLLLVRVAGNAKESAKIKSFTTDYPSYETAAVNFSTTLNNDGNVHVQPKGVITIRNWFGGQVAAVDVNSSSSNVLPGSERTFASSWKDPGFKVGYYTATVDLTYGSPSQSLTAKVSFWIVPWKTLLILLVLLILLIVALYFSIKRYNSWIIFKASSKKN